jgi:hypothetical protein
MYLLDNPLQKNAAGSASLPARPACWQASLRETPYLGCSLVTRLVLSVFVLLVFSFSCAKEEEAPPPISPDQLMEIIAEALILEPAGREMPYVTQDSIYKKYYTLILKERGHTMEDFISSMQWLQKDPKRLEETYNKVLEHIQVIEAEANN